MDSRAMKWDGRGAHGSRTHPTVATTDDVIGALINRAATNLQHYAKILIRSNDAEAIHQLRVNARRLRSELHVLTRVLRREPLTTLDQELRRVGKALGRQRDLEVLTGVLESDVPPSILAPDSPVYRELQRKVIAENNAVFDLVRSGRFRRLVIDLSTAAKHPPVRRSATTSIASILVPGLRTSLDSLLMTVDLLDESPDDEDLHRIRIEAKKCRYSAEIADTFLDGFARDVAFALAELQDVLGTHHDHVVAIEYLRARQSERALNGFFGPPDSLQAAIDALIETKVGSLSQWRAPLEIVRAHSRALFSERAATVYSPSRLFGHAGDERDDRGHDEQDH